MTLVGLCLLHGATFLKLRTTGPVRERARALGRPIGWVAIALVVGFVVWTRTVGGPDVPDPVQVLALLAVIAAVLLTRDRPRRLRVRRLGGRDRGVRRLDLHRPLSERDGLQHERRPTT